MAERGSGQDGPWLVCLDDIACNSKRFIGSAMDSYTSGSIGVFSKASPDNANHQLYVK